MRRNWIILILAVFALSGCANLSTVPNSSRLSAKSDLMQKSVKLLNSGEFKDATTTLNAALKLNPEDPQLNFLNAVTYHMRAFREGIGYHPLAEEGYKLAIKFDPSVWYYYLYYGLGKLDQGQFHAAKLILADGLYLQPDDADLVYAFLYASYYDTDILNASAALNRLQELEPESARTKVAGVILAAARGDLFLARNQLQKLQPILAKPDLPGRLKVRIEEWGSTLSYLSVQENRKIPEAQKEPVASVPEVPQMIVVDATIIRNEEDTSNRMGVNLLSGLKLQFGSSTPYASAPLYGSSSTENITENYTQDKSGAWVMSNSAKAVTSAVTRAITVPALEYSLNIFNMSSSRSEVLARPTLVAALDKESHFFAGTEINASIKGDTFGSSYSSSTTINKEVRVRLTIKPSDITADSVRMKVQLERSYLMVPDTGIVLYDYMMVTSKTEVVADVLIRYGETLMLSGLIEKESLAQRDGVPLLQDIPLIQYLFARRDDDVFQRSILIMPTPYRNSSSSEFSRRMVSTEDSADSMKLMRLKKKYYSWYSGVNSNFDSILTYMKEFRLNREARRGDLLELNSGDDEVLGARLKKALQFLYF